MPIINREKYLFIENTRIPFKLFFFFYRYFNGTTQRETAFKGGWEIQRKANRSILRRLFFVLFWLNLLKNRAFFINIYQTHNTLNLHSFILYRFFFWVLNLSTHTCQEQHSKPAPTGKKISTCSAKGSHCTTLPLHRLVVDVEHILRNSIVVQPN